MLITFTTSTGKTVYGDNKFPCHARLNPVKDCLYWGSSYEYIYKNVPENDACRKYWPDLTDDELAEFRTFIDSQMDEGYLERFNNATGPWEE